MITESMTVAIIALAIAVLSFVLAGVAYWRAGGRRDLAVLREKERLLLDELSKKIRTGYEDSLSRIRRGERRLAELRSEASATLKQSIDALARELASMGKEAEDALIRLKSEVSSGAQAAEEALAKRVRRLEGRIQVLIARAEMVRAEHLAEKHQFAEAEHVLEDAVAKVREVRTRLSDRYEEDRAFADVISSLQSAIHAVRAEAEDHKQQIDRVLSASDRLLLSLERHEQRAM